ncbi:MAG: flagellar biosynthesis protein FlhB [Planctomycetota bacterium]
MPERSSEDRTEEATPRKRQEARERGHVAKSQDLAAAVVLFLAMIVFYVMGMRIFEGMFVMSRAVFEGLSSVTLTTENLTAYTARGIWYLLGVCLPAMAILVGGAIGANLLQVGGVMSGHPLMPEWERISPAAGFRRLFSKQALLRLVFSIFKIAIIGVVAYFTLKEQLPATVNLVRLELWPIFHVASHFTFVLGIRISLALLVLAILDYGYQRWEYEANLRMTKQEMKEDMRRMEGDPLIRVRRRSLHRQMAMQRMMQDVPKADVVITNPTEFAVAIRYDQAEMRAAKVVAKGQRLVAQRIREIAMASGIPIYEQKWLARTLFKEVEVGSEIPEELYKAVAEVLAYVYRLEESRRQTAAG